LELGFVNLGELGVGVQRYAPNLNIDRLLIRVWVINLSIGLHSREFIAYLVHDFATLIDCVSSSIYPSDR
jgi:hypothetical protein